MEFIEYFIYASVYVGIVATTFYIISFFYGVRVKKKLFKDFELPSVSIMIPVYNEGQSVVTTLKSILKSDYPKGKIEIVVVDDGSSDNTFKLARKFQGKQDGKNVRVFRNKHGGKGAALNFALRKVKGEIVFSMDADTIVEVHSVKEMVKYFKEKKVMCVTPAMTIYKPKGILQKVQYIEYMTGLFLRKTFSSLNAMHITPGAFSAYRKSFFDKHGGYDVGNITEDLEVSMRIQYLGYIIENTPDAPAYTVAPKKFMHLLRQRRRWYVGLMRNVWKYKKIFSRKYGDLGIFVLPVALVSIFFCVFITVFLFFKTLLTVKDEIIFLSNINFDFGNIFDFNLYVLERAFFLFITDPVIIFILMFVVVVGFYLHFASKKIGNIVSPISGMILFFMFFAIFFGFWWVVSLFYIVFNRRVSWK